MNGLQHLFDVIPLKTEYMALLALCLDSTHEPICRFLPNLHLHTAVVVHGTKIFRYWCLWSPCTFLSLEPNTEYLSLLPYFVHASSEGSPVPWSLFHALSTKMSCMRGSRNFHQLGPGQSDKKKSDIVFLFFFFSPQLTFVFY